MKSKKIAFLIVAFSLLLCGCGSQKKTDLEKLSVRGKVKQIIELQYLAKEKFGKVEKGDSYREEGWDEAMEFNEEGYFTKKTSFDMYGREVGYSDYTYNEQGQLLEIRNYDAEGGFSDKNVYRYDEKKRVVEIINFGNSDRLNFSQVLEYNDKERQVTSSHYDARGKLLDKTIYLMENEYPVETKEYNTDNVLCNHRKEKYNKSGQQEELTVYVPRPMQILFEYDKKGNLVSRTGTDGEDGEAFSPVRYEYEFDEQGNWTKKIEYIGGKPSILVERQIDYY